MQHALGNQAMQRLLRSGAIQAKLTVSQPGDPSEQEADRVAEAVLRMPEPRTSERTPVTAAPPESRFQRICDECEEELHRQPMEEEEEEETLQAKPAPDHTLELTPAVEAPVRNLRGGGQPLPDSVRAFFEPRFGYDFSQVRIHTDARAAESAWAVNAEAYTVGRHIVLSAGRYEPGTTDGKRLLAHELAHVVQQGHGTVGERRTTPVNGSGSGNVDQEVRRGMVAPPPVQQAVGPRLQRQADLGQVPPDLRCPVAAGRGHLAAAKVQIQFAEGSSALSAGAIAEIERFVAEWTSRGSREDIFIHGYASVDGPQPLNWRLSCDRAESVKTELIGQGIPADRITLFAHGETNEFSDTQFPPNRRAGINTLPSRQASCADLAEQARKAALPQVAQARTALDRLHSRWINHKQDILTGTRTLEGEVVCAFDSNFNITQRDPGYGVRHIRVMSRLRALERRMDHPVPYACQPADDPVCAGGTRDMDTIAFVRKGRPPIHFCPSFRDDLELVGQQASVIHEFGHLLPGVGDEGGYAFGGLGSQLLTCEAGKKFVAASDILTRTADALAGFVVHIGEKGATDIRVR